MDEHCEKIVNCITEKMQKLSYKKLRIVYFLVVELLKPTTGDTAE